jgi:microcystin-dependent protein
MAETLTPHYSWIKPDIGGDASTWGNVLNTTFDAIDAVAWNNQQAGSVIGSIQMFAGSTLPTNWLWCNGAVYLDTDIPVLAPILNRKFAGSDATHNAVPNLNARFAVGADFSTWPLGLQGGEQNHTLAVTELPVHSHAGSQAAHTHPGSYQDGHNHTASQDAHQHVVPQNLHSHNIVTGSHNHSISTGTHSHGNVMTPASGYFSLGSANPQITAGRTDTAGDLGGVASLAGSLGGNTDGQYANIPGSVTDIRQPNAYTGSNQPGVHIDTQTPVVTIGNTGSGVAVNNMPPYTTVGFIIRWK